MSRSRLRIGKLEVDALRFEEALDAIDELVQSREGGCVFTPNIDHVVMAEDNAKFREAYSSAKLSLADGQPLVWISPLLGLKLPEKISGSDLVVPLIERASDRGWRIFFLGAGPGVAELAAEKLRARLNVQIVGTAWPMIDTNDSSKDAEIVASIKKTKPDLVFVALGCPKQELFCHRVAKQLSPAVLLGIGAALDFIAGTVKRAPPWVSRMGFEWLYRLAQEPRRLWRRYLVQDPKFVLSVAKTLRIPKEKRVVRPAADRS
ncbi:MAG: WecB/TagA/CpsF family glycosyltransferase [Myxococcaceae bacterium]